MRGPRFPLWGVPQEVLRRHGGRWPDRVRRARKAVPALAAGHVLAGQVSSPLSSANSQVRACTGRPDPLPPVLTGGSVLSSRICRANCPGGRGGYLDFLRGKWRPIPSLPHFVQDPPSHGGNIPPQTAKPQVRGLQVSTPVAIGRCFSPARLGLVPEVLSHTGSGEDLCQKYSLILVNIR